VDSAYRFPETLPACAASRERDADGEGRSHRQQRDRDAEHQQRSQERSGDHAQVERVHGGGGRQQDRLGDDGISPSVAPPQARKVNIVCGMRGFVSLPPADGVTGREIDQDQADDDRPDQVDAAEAHLQQARSAKLGRQRGHAGEEDCEGDVASHWGGLYLPRVTFFYRQGAENAKVS
jgi:hypothetical protein